MGCKGQLGSELMALADTYGCKAIGFDRDSLDISQLADVAAAVAKYKPDAVINAAAYTAVDKAESDQEAAQAVNATAVSHLARSCAEHNIPLLHVSTDYVFDGSKKTAYSETDTVSPLGVYGETKLAGEEAVLAACEKYYILRTSWVFSAHGNNFVKTMLRLGAERSELGVVGDQYGKPTSAREIARVIYEMLNSNKEAWGIYHIAQPDAVSWHGFAQEIFTEAQKQSMSLQIQQVKAIGTDDYPTAAKRPVNSELNCQKLQSTFGITLAPWAESLKNVVKELKND